MSMVPLHQFAVMLDVSDLGKRAELRRVKIWWMTAMLRYFASGMA